jgi:hypothetical protein
VKKSLLWFAVTLFVATLSMPPTATADAPICGPNGCSKPGVRSLMPGTPTGDAPICGPNGCQKPGLR